LFRGCRQVLACHDICSPDAPEVLSRLLDEAGGCDLVYSDPPWNPGNEKYWRNHAGAAEGAGYVAFLEAWCRLVGICIGRGARHVFCEQSENDSHRGMLLAVAEGSGWGLPLLEQWTVYYGSPGSASVRRPNRLLHFGRERIATDPSGMAGEPMTIRACAGLSLPPGSTVVDVCMGKGMTSRMAHYFGWNCVGTELNPKRLAVTVAWLERQGYRPVQQEVHHGS